VVRRGKGKSWEYCTAYDTLEVAHQVIIAECCWHQKGIRGNKKTKSVTKNQKYILNVL